MTDIHSTQPKRDTILVAEDEPQMQELITDLLTEHGFKVLATETGHEAIDMFKKNIDEIALVVLDVMLPELDGRETYFRLKEIDPGVKVLLCSGYTSLVEIQSLLEKHNLQAVQKPFDPDEFIKLVQDVISEKLS